MATKLNFLIVVALIVVCSSWATVSQFNAFNLTGASGKSWRIDKYLRDDENIIPLMGADSIKLKSSVYSFYTNGRLGYRASPDSTELNSTFLIIDDSKLVLAKDTYNIEILEPYVMKLSKERTYKSSFSVTNSPVGPKTQEFDQRSKFTLFFKPL